MSTKDLILFILLSIFTLGIFPLVIYLKGRKQKNSQKLSESKKVVVDVEQLKKFVGGLKNIVGIEFTHSKVTIFVKERELVSTTKIKKLHGISGVFANSGGLTIIVGNSARKIANQILN